ncbi:hypothetical protein N7492_007475 [Penicillium capsulatum]|uniref:Amidase domain-containing protein n=1 Tax=Penicillium capsulatum TaxID=69766 RepID=A0A9W9HZX5_9EURO|nr:hypothetical protein N7492_007475 [Penicillium capsulatum]
MGISRTAFNINELTIATFHAALRQQTTSCTAVVCAYLERIAHHDQALQSLISINNNAIAAAHEKDEETRTLCDRNQPFPTLHGVPVILKDNIGTFDLPTSAGNKALATLRTSEDSSVVADLRRAGAIILAKANLHEFALHGTTTSSLGGQTRNPYDLTRTPGGSSGGTAAALAANLGLVGCGSPVEESSRCADVVYGDDGGMEPAGRESRPPGEIRIGVLDAYFHLEESRSSLPEALVEENEIVQRVIRAAVSSIGEAVHITLVPVEPTADWRLATLLVQADTQAFEFRECLDGFLQSSVVSSTPHRSLESIAQSGEFDKNAITEVFTAPLEKPEIYSRRSAEYRAQLDFIASLKESVQRCFDAAGIDFMVYPHQRHLAVPIGMTRQPRRNGVLAALTGRPAICVPAGRSPPTPSAIQGIPIGLEIMGRYEHDEALLDVAEQIEYILQARATPIE